jgi:photosystem II stability/assembly factor-like uncharacterized protein
MKFYMRFLTCVLLAAVAITLPPDHVVYAAVRTPVSCLKSQFYFGQDTLLVMNKNNYLFKAAPQGWQPLVLPDGEYDISVTPDGSIYLFNGAIYRSTDDGTSWNLTGQAPATGGLFGNLSPSPVPNLLFIGATLPGPATNELYRSIDDGVNWSKVGNGGKVEFSPNFAEDGVAFTTLIYYHGLVLGVWKTVDWGQTWFQASNGLSPSMYGFVGIAVSPQFSIDHTVFSVPGGWLLQKTTDGGATWFEINELTVSGPPALSPNYSRDQTFIIGQDYNLALSQDGGRTLTPIWDKANGSAVVWGVRRQDPSAEPPAPLVPLPAAHHYYLPLIFSGPPPLEFWLVAEEVASGDCYLYRSRDNGASWQEIAVP